MLDSGKGGDFRDNQDLPDDNFGFNTGKWSSPDQETTHTPEPSPFPNVPDVMTYNGGITPPVPPPAPYNGVPPYGAQPVPPPYGAGQYGTAPPPAYPPQYPAQPPYPPPYHQQYNPYHQPYYQVPPPGAVRNQNGGSGLAIASMVLGIVSVVGMMSGLFWIGIIGLILGCVSLAQKRGSKPMAVVGVVLCSIAIVVGIFLVIYWVVAPLNEQYYSYDDYSYEAMKLISFIVKPTKPTS